MTAQYVFIAAMAVKHCPDALGVTQAERTDVAFKYKVAALKGHPTDVKPLSASGQHCGLTETQQ